MTASERIGHFLVALPLAHVLGASLFLWSYCLGFGANIAAHATVADLLSVSIADMVPAYLASLVFPAILAANRLGQGAHYAIDKANDIPDLQIRDRSIKRIEAIRLVIAVGAAFIFFTTMIYIIYQIFHDRNIDYMIVNVGVSMSSAIALMIWMASRGMGGFYFEMSVILLVFVTNLFFQGMNRGQTDRWMTYEFASKQNSLCQSAAVLRSFSPNFLAVLPNGEKALISGECAVRFKINPPNSGRKADPATPATGGKVQETRPPAAT